MPSGEVRKGRVNVGSSLNEGRGRGRGRGVLNRGRGRGRACYGGDRTSISESPTTIFNGDESIVSATSTSIPSISGMDRQHRTIQEVSGAMSGRGRGRGRGRGWNNGNGEARQISNSIPSTQGQRARPTHFLALPLHNHPSLRDHVAAFHSALFEPPSHLKSPAKSAPVTSALGTDFLNFNALSIDQSPNPSSTGTKIGPGSASKPSLTVSNTTTAPSGSKAKGKGRTPSATSPSVSGLDTSIVIDPRRMHMTLGVMALSLARSDNVAQKGVAGESYGDDVRAAEATPASEPSPSTTPSAATIQPTPATSSSVTMSADPSPQSTPAPNAPSSSPSPSMEPKTVASALNLLTSLKPRISEILSGSKGVVVPLEEMDVLKTSRMPVPKPRPETERAGSVEDERGAWRGYGMNHSEKTVGGEGKGEGALEVGAGSSGEAKEFVTKGSVEVALEKDKIGAGVLFIGPRNKKSVEEDKDREERRKLMEVCSLVNTAFKSAGYLTDTRSLKLHCTILNASHRKPARRMPFCYTDILQSPAIMLLGAGTGNSGVESVSIDTSDRDSLVVSLSLENESGANVEVTTETKTSVESASTSLSDPTLHFVPSDTPSLSAPGLNRNPNRVEHDVKHRSRTRPLPLQIPPPLPIDLGAYRVHEIQLWEMGSHGPNNEYVNCGGVVLE